MLRESGHTCISISNPRTSSHQVVAPQLQDVDPNYIRLKKNMSLFWDLVFLLVQIPFSLAILEKLLTQPFNKCPRKDLKNLNLLAWPLESGFSNQVAARIEATQDG